MLSDHKSAILDHKTLYQDHKLTQADCKGGESDHKAADFLSTRKCSLFLVERDEMAK